MATFEDVLEVLTRSGYVVLEVNGDRSCLALGPAGDLKVYLYPTDPIVVEGKKTEPVWAIQELLSNVL